jgi:DNA repair protein RadC
VTAPEAAEQVLMAQLAGLDGEACVAAYLDTKHRLLATELISLGSIDHTFMSPRDIYRGALLANASAVVLAHNHPSGDAEPSRDNEMLTRRLVRAGELIGVELLEHLMIAGDRWVSLEHR